MISGRAVWLFSVLHCSSKTVCLFLQIRRCFENLGDDSCLLRQNGERSAFCDCVNPGAALEVLRLAAQVTVKVVNAAGLQVRLFDVLFVVFDTVDAQAALSCLRLLLCRRAMFLPHLRRGSLKPRGLEDDGCAVFHGDEAECGILNSEFLRIPIAPSVACFFLIAEFL